MERGTVNGGNGCHGRGLESRLVYLAIIIVDFEGLNDNGAEKPMCQNKSVRRRG